ncbi:neutral zinc metallopeptidase [Mycobacterium sp. OAS707]|uniref:neutral zinc metallopeptidase n=1 Tax=Mycobacterium sp. OAS707 TaxID=2663822 RepID=UPI00178BC66B
MTHGCQPGTGANDRHHPSRLCAKRFGITHAVRLALAVASWAIVLAGCSHHTVLDGRALSMRYDPMRVAGLPASDGPSGPRQPLPAVANKVRNTDGGDIDRAALLAVQDIENFWEDQYSNSFTGQFTPVSWLISVDPTDQDSPDICGAQAAEFDFNALYCRTDNVIAWDRTDLMPVAKKYFGDMAINGLLAHEYGHAVQWMAKLVGEDNPSTLVREQQADCFAGTYMRWVAEGHSPRFTINTTRALDQVIAGAIAVRDPISTLADLSVEVPSHGTALDRVSAFQMGFDVGASSCAAIDDSEIAQRRGNLPNSLFDPASPQSDMTIDADTLSTLLELLGQIFAPAQPPTLSSSGTGCGGSAQPPPAAYCAATNTITVNVPLLQQIGTPADEHQNVLLQGDNTALSVVTSRYVLALQHERGRPVDSPVAAMRTACLTGVAQRRMADPVVTPSGRQLVLGAGDLDEAVSGLLTNGMAASDANGTVVPSGFTRITAFRTGLLGDADGCYRRFP